MHVMIIPTMGCPANCSYCWSSETTSLCMSTKTMDDIVEWLKTFKKEPVTFTFHGGEPLLAGYEFFEYSLDKSLVIYILPLQFKQIYGKWMIS